MADSSSPSTCASSWLANSICRLASPLGITVASEGPLCVLWTYQKTFLLNTVVVSFSTLISTAVCFLALFFWVTNRNLHIKENTCTVKEKRSIRSAEGVDLGELGLLEEAGDGSTDEATTDDDDFDEGDEAAQKEKEGGDTFGEGPDLGVKRVSFQDKERSSYLRSIKMGAIDRRRRRLLRTFLDHPTEEDDDTGAQADVPIGGLKNDPPIYNRRKSDELDENARIRRRERRNMRNDLMEVVSSMKIFSYLSAEAFTKVMEHMEYVDLPQKGMTLFDEAGGGEGDDDGRGSAGQNLNDGSLYAVVSGGVICTCPLDHYYDIKTGSPRGRGGVVQRENSASSDAGASSDQGMKEDEGLTLRFTAGPGDVVTSLLAMLSGLVRQYRLRENHRASDNDLASSIFGIPSSLADGFPSLRIASGLRAVSTSDDTRLVRVPAKCFLHMLDEFPSDVIQVAQTILCRTQRVTMQTLVRSLGLGSEILLRARDRRCHMSCGNGGCNFTSGRKSEEWKRLDAAFCDENVTHDLEDLPESVKKDAAVAAAAELGAPDCLSLIQDSSSLVAVYPGETLIRSGSEPDAVYLLLHGTIDFGMSSARIAKDHDEAEEDSTVRRRSILHSRKSARGLNGSIKSPRSSDEGIQTLYHLTPGQIIGQLSSFTSTVSIISARNSSSHPSILLRIPKRTLDSILLRHPSALISSLDYILSDIISPVVHLLDWNLEWLHVQAGEAVAHRNEPCDSLYVVLNGRLRAAPVHVGRGNNHGVGGAASAEQFGAQGGDEEFGRGACIGEMEVLTGSNWPSDVYAVRNSELARMPLSVLKSIIRTFPRAGLHFAGVIASSLNAKYRQREGRGGGGSGRSHGGGDIARRESDIFSREAGAPASPLPSYGLTLATIAVVPFTPDDEFFSLPEFCSALTSTLKTIAPARLMTKAVAELHLGDLSGIDANEGRMSAVHELKINRFLGDTEENHRLVVYQADARYTWWTRLCLQQADCILLVVRSDRAPEGKEVERCLECLYDAFRTRIELVVVKVPCGKRGSIGKDDDDDFIRISDEVNDWSERRRYVTRHHLIHSSPFESLDFHRMCRRITGRSVGLVLGGGGARGLAHLGVIKALQEAGVVVDMVGGTSQGAYVGALYAKTPDNWGAVMGAARTMADTLADMREKLFDLTLPLTSFFSGYRFNRGIIQSIGLSTRIQDLALDYFCVSTDIIKCSQTIHRKGPAWKYVRASMSLQGYLPPICEDGSMLLDGGYMNVLPADVMLRRMGARIVIAVDVAAEASLDYYEYGTHLSGWWLLWNSWNPFVKTMKVPSMGDLSERLAWLSADTHMNRIADDIDLYFKPPVQGYGTLEYDKFDEIVEKGYEYAKPIVAEWVRRNPWLVTESSTRRQLAEEERPE